MRVQRMRARFLKAVRGKDVYELGQDCSPPGHLAKIPHIRLVREHRAVSGTP